MNLLAFMRYLWIQERILQGLWQMWGQPYDGEEHMAGKHSGAQAIIKKKQPLTPYIHCGSHWGNLITQHACTASGVIHSALQLVHEFGILFGQSGNLNLCSRKLQNLFKGPTNLLCPFCPTRWAVRSSAIMLCWINVTLMLALNEIAAGSTDTANRANGLHERFQQGNVL